MKSLRSSTAIRKPARTLLRVIPAVATVLPPALAGSPSVGGARQVTMPLASATQVALSRLTRILLLVAVALCLGAPTAGAVPAKKLDNNLAALWTTILETPSAQNPFGTGGAAFACFDLGGTVAPFGPGGVESCTVKPGTKIFVAASSVECSTFEGNGTTDAELRTCARDRRRESSAHRHRRRQVRAGDRGGDTPAEHRPARGQHFRAASGDARSVRGARLGRALTPADARDAYDRHRHRHASPATITTTIVVEPGR